ncbi:MAG: hypothetical protein ACFFAE_12755 [Candidatus Hodarchaeota archaeon]
MSKIFQIFAYYFSLSIISASSVAQVLITVAWVDLYSYQADVSEFIMSSVLVAPFSLISGFMWPFTVISGIYAIILSTGSGYIPEIWISPLILLFVSIIFIVIIYALNTLIPDENKNKKYNSSLLIFLGGQTSFILIITVYPFSLVLGNNFLFLIGNLAAIMINIGLLIKWGEYRVIFSPNSNQNLIMRFLIFGSYFILSTGCIGLVIITDPTLSHSFLVHSLFWYSTGFSVIFLIFRAFKIIQLSYYKDDIFTT